MAENWELATELAKVHISKLSDKSKLEVYGFFKQATVGDCNTDKPGMFALKEKAKWEAWEKVKGLTPLQAQLGYIKVLVDNVPECAAELKH